MTDSESLPPNEVFKLLDYHSGNLPKINKLFDTIERIIENGGISYEIIEFSRYDEELLNESIEQYWHDFRNTESDEHELLKAYGASYIRELEKEPKFEQRTWFGVADVGTVDKTIFVECGKMEVDKILSALGYEHHGPFIGEENENYRIADQLIIIPYSMNEDIPPVKGISFYKNHK